MICRQVYAILGGIALSMGVAGVANATILTFADNPVPSNNKDLAVNYGSNIGAATAAFVDGGEGMTPDVALTWAPTGGPENVNSPTADVLEYHSATTFSTNVGAPGFVTPVLQLDVDASNHDAGFVPADVTVDFTMSNGAALRMYSVEIGNASDQTETGHPWNIRLVRLSDLAVVASYTTGVMVAGSKETALLNYIGDPGQNYRLVFDDGNSTVNADHNPRTAIDNLRFGQIPEPTTMLLGVICGLGFVLGRRRLAS